MKNILILLAGLVVVSSVHASDFDDACKDRYRTAALNVISLADQFNDGEITNVQFLGQYAAVKANIVSLRVACAMEPDEIKNCVQSYKNKYLNLISRFSSVEIARGEQTSIRGLRLSEVGISLVDLKCQAEF